MREAARSLTDSSKPDDLLLAVPAGHPSASPLRTGSTLIVPRPAAEGSGRTGKSKAAREEHLSPGTVSSHGLQKGLLLVLALYASMALLNLESALSALSRGWQQFVEFLAGGIF